MNRQLIRCVSWYLVFAMFLIGIAPKVDAGISPSEALAIPGFDRVADLQKVQKFIEMKMVKERLGKLGFSQDEVQSKLSQLSDEQLHQFSQKLDDFKVAGDDALGVIIALLVIAILIVILLKITGHRVVVT
ncbi:MAG: PA2779 family protein [Nitrospirae bacterium]|nr:PA2779 family protein [Nitrospirota bacterium]